MSMSATGKARMTDREREKKKHAREWRYSLTEHVQADFLGFLSCLVLGDASVISFIHLFDFLYYQFRTILVQAVFVARFKDDVVTVEVGKEKKGRRFTLQDFCSNTFGSPKKTALTETQKTGPQWFGLSFTSNIYFSKSLETKLSLFICFRTFSRDYDHVITECVDEVALFLSLISQKIKWQK